MDNENNDQFRPTLYITVHVFPALQPPCPLSLSCSGKSETGSAKQEQEEEVGSSSSFPARKTEPKP